MCESSFRFQGWGATWLKAHGGQTSRWYDRSNRAGGSQKGRNGDVQKKIKNEKQNLKMNALFYDILVVLMLSCLDLQTAHATNPDGTKQQGWIQAGSLFLPLFRIIIAKLLSTYILAWFLQHIQLTLLISENHLLMSEQCHRRTIKCYCLLPTVISWISGFSQC